MLSNNSVRSRHISDVHLGHMSMQADATTGYSESAGRLSGNRDLRHAYTAKQPGKVQGDTGESWAVNSVGDKMLFDPSNAD